MKQFSFLLLISGFILGYSFTIGRDLFHNQRLRQFGMSLKHEFVKYQGLGNDFILVDNLESSHLKYTADQSVRLCDRNFGIGGDGVIFALPGQNGCDYTMRIYNSDGSEPQMCGNGIRCLAKFLHLLETTKGTEQKKIYRIWTNAGVIVPKLTDDGLVTVDMGEPILSPNNKIPTTLTPTKAGRVVDAEIVGLGKTYYTTAVSMGNPHSVIFVENVDSMDGGPDFPVIGPVMEKHPAFPERVNTEFVQVLNRNHVRVKVWERGAGPTLACGTGACAVAVAGVLTGRTERNCKVTLPGGDLFIEWKEGDNHIYMTGPAEPVFQGTVTMALLVSR